MANIKRLGQKRETTEIAKDNLAEENSKEVIFFDENQARRLGRVQFFMVLGLFIGVGLVTELVSYLLGKTAGTVALCIIAGIIAVILYKDEILSYFSRKKH